MCESVTTAGVMHAAEISGAALVMSCRLWLSEDERNVMENKHFVIQRPCIMIVGVAIEIILHILK